MYEEIDMYVPTVEYGMMRIVVPTLLGVVVTAVSLYHIREGKDFAYQYPAGFAAWWTRAYEITWLLPLTALSVLYLACIPKTNRIPVGVPTALHLLYGAICAQLHPHPWLNWEDILNGEGPSYCRLLWMVGAVW